MVRAALLIGLALMTVGCGPGRPFAYPQSAGWPQTQLPPPPNPQSTQMFDLNQRASNLNVDNRDLQARIAQQAQQVQSLQGHNDSLRRLLGDTEQRLRMAQAAQQQAERRMKAVQDELAQQGGAVFRPNSSLQGALQKVDLAGAEVRQDRGDIRVSIPSDPLFEPGTANLTAAAGQTIARLAQYLQTNYRNNIVAIEAHTDSQTQVAGGNSQHWLTTGQAVMLFQEFRRLRLPTEQFEVIGKGANQPLFSSGAEIGRAKNRRIELVIRPQTFR